MTTTVHIINRYDYLIGKIENVDTDKITFKEFVNQVADFIFYNWGYYILKPIKIDGDWDNDTAEFRLEDTDGYFWNGIMDLDPEYMDIMLERV